MPVSKLAYCTWTALALAPPSTPIRLAATSFDGLLALFNLDDTCNGDAEWVVDIGNGERICSAITAADYLVIATPGEISGWEWKSLSSGTEWRNRPSWSIPVVSRVPLPNRVDVDALHWDAAKRRLYLGCSDGDLHAVDLETQRIIATYSGHSDYIHSIDGIDDNVISGSEDGSVKLWDVRVPKPCNEFFPHKIEKLCRPDIGKWIGSVSISNDWIICGGGPKLGLWSKRTLDISSVLEIPNHGIHATHFHEDCIIAAGTAQFLYQLNYCGDIVIEIPVSATTVYSVVYQSSPRVLLAIAGSSPDIDLCTSFNYKDKILSVKNTQNVIKSSC